MSKLSGEEESGKSKVDEEATTGSRIANEVTPTPGPGPRSKLKTNRKSIGVTTHSNDEKVGKSDQKNSSVPLPIPSETTETTDEDANVANSSNSNDANEVQVSNIDEDGNTNTNIQSKKQSESRTGKNILEKGPEASESSKLLRRRSNRKKANNNASAIDTNAKKSQTQKIVTCTDKNSNSNNNSKEAKLEAKNPNTKTNTATTRRRSKRKRLDSSIPASVAVPVVLPGNEEGKSDLNISPLSIKSFAFGTRSNSKNHNDPCEEAISPTKQPLTTGPGATVKLLLDGQLEGIIRTEEQAQASQAAQAHHVQKKRTRYNLRSSRKPAGVGSVGDPSKKGTATSHSNLPEPHSNADNLGASKVVPVKLQNSSPVDKNLNFPDHGTQLRTTSDAIACRPKNGGTALVTTTSLSQTHKPKRKTRRKKGSKIKSQPRSSYSASGKIKIDFKRPNININMSVQAPPPPPPITNTPIKRTPVNLIRKSMDFLPSATRTHHTASKPWGGARKRKRTYHRRKNIMTHSSNASSDEYHYTSTRTMLGTLGLNSLNISSSEGENKNDHTKRERASYNVGANPPPMSRRCTTKDIIAPDGIEALSAPTLPDLNDMHNLPSRKRLKIRTRGLINFGGCDDDIFEFN